MRILHIIESDGGTVEFIFLLAKYSPEVEHVVYSGKRAWDALKKIEQLKPSDFPRNLFLIPWNHVAREISPLEDTFALWELIKWLKKQKTYTAIHLHSSKAGFLGRIATQLLLKKNVVYTTQAVSFIRHDISNLKRALFVFLERLGSWLGGTVVCCSDSERQAMLEKGINAITIPNGTQYSEAPLFQPKNENTIRIVSVGRATIQKNPALYKEIAEKFLSFPEVIFIWVGDGELREELISENIKITGWLSRDQVREELSEADIYISTASWEGMPFAVLEAMAYAKPLVVSKCIGNIDLVEKETNGFVFATVEEAVLALKCLIENKTKRLEMGHNSRILFETKYNFEIIAKEFLALYATSSDPKIKLGRREQSTVS